MGEHDKKVSRTYEGDFPEDMSQAEFLLEQYQRQNNQISEGIRQAEQHIGNANVLSADILSGKEQQSQQDQSVEESQNFIPEMPQTQEPSEAMKRYLNNVKANNNPEQEQKKMEDYINKVKTQGQKQGTVPSIEDLVFLGRMQKEIDFYGHKIILQTLTTMENMEIVDEVAHLDIVSRFAATVLGSLARAIKQIDGYKFYAANDSDVAISKFPNLLKAKEWLIQLQQPLTDRLWEEYNYLLNDQKEKLSEVKN